MTQTQAEVILDRVFLGHHEEDFTQALLQVIYDLQRRVANLEKDLNE